MAIFQTDDRAFADFIGKVETTIDRISCRAKEEDISALKKLIANFRLKTEDFYRENRKLNIGVVGQVKAGKSSFLNTLLFDGKEILPKASTPKTATLTKMEYAEENVLQIEYYSVEEWELQQRNAQVDLDDELYLAARELVEMVERNGIEPQPYLEKGIERRQFSTYEDLISALNDYVGEDGKLTPLVKAVTLYLHKEEFRGLSIVDTPGLNDPIPSRTMKTKEFMELCDVVFFLSQSGSFLDKSDWELLSAQLPQKGVKKLVLIASKYDSGVRDILRLQEDDDIFGEDENNADNIPKACRIIRKKLKKRARSKVEEFVRELEAQEKSPELIAVIRQCAEPVFVSAMAYNMSRKSVSDYSAEEQNLYDALRPFSDDMQADLELLGNLQEVQTLFDEAVAEKEKLLAQKEKSFLPNVREELKGLLSGFLEKTKQRILVLEQNDREQLLEQKQFVEKQIGSIKADIAALFGDLTARLEAEKAQGVRELREAGKDYLNVKERIGTITKTGSYTTGFWFWKRRHTYTYEEHYSYCIAADAIENLQKYAIEAANQVEEVFTNALQIKELKRKILDVVIHNFDMGSEKFDSSLFRLMVEESVSALEFPIFQVDISDAMSGISANFQGELTSAGQKTELSSAVQKAVSEIYEELCRRLSSSVKSFKEELQAVGEKVREELLATITGEFEELLAECEHKEQEIAGYREYQELFGTGNKGGAYAMTELELAQKQQNRILEGALENASAIITKEYLGRLEYCEPVVPSAEDIDIQVAQCGSFYRLTKLVLNREENFLNKLTTIVHVIASIGGSLCTIVKSDGTKIDYYFGIISKNVRDDREASLRRRKANAEAFHGALLGNLNGAELEPLSEAELSIFQQEVFAGEDNCYSAVSGVVGLRDIEDKSTAGYVQGIEKLVDSLKGQSYTIVMLADPVDTAQLQVVKQGYELLYTQLASFAHSSLTLNENDTMSLSKARTEGFSDGISKGIAMTQSKTHTKGRYFGASANIGINFGISAGIGINAGVNSSTADTNGRTDTKSEIRQRSRSVTDTASNSKTEGKSLQFYYENRSVKALLDRIDRHLERLDECESFGAFDCATYVIAKNRETALTVASNYHALMRGKKSGVQASHINSWYRPEETRLLGQYLRSLVHPRFWQNKNDGIIVTPASIVSGEELAIQVGLPKKSVSGITVVPMAEFGRNIACDSEHTLELGSLYHMGQDEGQKITIDIERLTGHTLITGSTGSGKTTAVSTLLDGLMKKKVRGSQKAITFLVIEPAKGEYKDRFGSEPNVKVYGTNQSKTPLLRINPFSFPQDIHVLEHIDRLIEIFNVCWPMYAAMPAVLKDAVERAYRVAGWNLESSVCRYKSSDNTPLFPNFTDVLRQILVVVEESAYSADSKGDYKGALCTRLKSLTNGLYGQIFSGDELSGEELFEQNVIVDLSRVGSRETKSLLMGLLVMKLQEYRMANAAGSNAPLQHLTVLEEAHHLLKKSSAEQADESANLLGKSVEMLSNSIAEMRTYGEGFVIADQAPGLLDLSVIRNTNTKIILRLPDLSDRELVGKAIGLNNEQILELSRLQTFVGAVYQNQWLEPVLCRLSANCKKCVPYVPTPEKKPDFKRRILEYLLLPLEKRNRLDKGYITSCMDHVYRMEIPTEAKLAFVRYTRACGQEELRTLRGKVLSSLFNTELAFTLAKAEKKQIDRWYASIKELLEPQISDLREEDQQKIIAALALEQAQTDREAVELFERLMAYI